MYLYLYYAKKKYLASIFFSFKSLSLNLLLLLLLFNCQYTTKQNKNKSFKLKSVQQLKSDDIFDLSGITLFNQDTFLIISDKQNKIYYLDTSNYHISPYFNLNKEEKLDLEAIGNCNQTIFLTFETGTNHIFKIINSEIQRLDFEYEEDFQPQQWGNKGLESVTINCIENILFFAKERSPAFLFKVDMNTIQPKARIIYTQELFQNPKNDVTDLKFVRQTNGNYLYVLKRFECQVDRINLETGKVISRSFAKYVNNKKKEQILYQVPKQEQFYGLAEALLVTADEIWVGLDNNGREINTKHRLAKKYNLKGNQPVIFRFRRNGF